MPRFRVSPFALALLVVMVAVMPRLDGAQEATLAATPLAKPQPPTQPTTGPGSSEALFGGVTAIKQALPDQFFADSWLFVPTDPLPGTTRSGKPFPLVIFVPGSGAVDADLYLAWIEHLVQRCPEDYATSTERVAAISHQAMAPRSCAVAEPTRSLVTAPTFWRRSPASTRSAPSVGQQPYGVHVAAAAGWRTPATTCCCRPSATNC